MKKPQQNQNPSERPASAHPFQDSNNESPYVTVVRRFMDNISSVKSCADTYLSASIDADKAAHKELFAAIASLKKMVSGEAPQFSMGDAIKSVKIIEQFRMNRSFGQAGLLARSLFLSIFSFFDAFTGDLLTALYRQRPELLDSSNKTMALKDIVSYKSIDDIREQVIHKEIEAFRRESYVEQFEILEKRFGIQDFRKLAGWQSFIECSQRRNLLTHCDGVVSGQYLQICRSEKCLPDPAPSVGDRLGLPLSYFYAAVDFVCEVGFNVAHVLWCKAVPDQRGVAEFVLEEQLQILLRQERWGLAEAIGRFGVKQKFSSDVMRRLIQIKYAQALKFAGKGKEAEAVIKSSDWSSCVPDLRMCASVLLDDFPAAAKFMRSSGVHGEHVRQIDYIDWPLFREFVKSEDFLSAYREVYEDDFGEALNNQIGQRFVGLVVDGKQEAQENVKEPADQPSEGRAPLRD
ncbi:hypothetical protein [Corallococcus sp. AB049A]|uniref:hypothetical protein n=1 Tax=Corallococcus sp. AB049A TaxID=2316721 RepID=UPI0011C40226|nr:hypothetical protein [Corallococcus sp. AB049A]